MKYLALWEMKPKDMDAVVKKYQELIAARALWGDNGLEVQAHIIDLKDN
jgi:hypothetical protein